MEALAKIAKRVRTARLAKVMSQRGLASASHVTLQHVQRIEYGRQDLTVRTLVRLAHALGVTPASFFETPS